MALRGNILCLRCNAAHANAKMARPAFALQIVGRVPAFCPRSGFRFRGMSQIVPEKRAFLVDTMALVHTLEGEGMTQKQAEAITAVVTEVLKDSIQSIAQSFVSKDEMQKSEMLHEAALSKFKGEMKSSQDHHFSLLQRDTERLRTDIEKLRSELRYETDKLTAGQRLDLNLQRGHIREELSKQNVETSNLTNKLDREIHALKTQLATAKYEGIKYCIAYLTLRECSMYYESTSLTRMITSFSSSYPGFQAEHTSHPSTPVPTTSSSPRVCNHPTPGMALPPNDLAHKAGNSCWSQLRPTPARPGPITRASQIVIMLGGMVGKWLPVPKLFLFEQLSFFVMI